MAVNLDDRDLRQRELVPPDRLSSSAALIVGVGAIGRQVAMQMTAIGTREITLVDFDTVDVVNLAPQGYAPSDLGQLKVEATAASCRHLNPELMVRSQAHRFRRSSVKTLGFFDVASRLTARHQLAVFCCVDSITTRSIVWETVKDRVDFFVDARMSAEVIRVLASGAPNSDEHYSQTLFGATEAFAGSCTAKSTIYTASIAAGLMLSQFTRWLRGIAVDRDLLLNLLAAELVAG